MDFTRGAGCPKTVYMGNTNIGQFCSYLPLRGCYGTKKPTNNCYGSNRGEEMPHIIVKMFPGRTDEQKQLLTDEIVKNVVSVTSCAEKSVSVAIEEVEPDDWDEMVYKPDILENRDKLYKNPGYNNFE